MNSPTSCSNAKFDKEISQEQFAQVVEAILEGKYSWACVLLLRFSGYNPLHYIPYRTYNRLLKENCPVGRPDKHKTPGLNASNHHSKSKITDIAYLELVSEQHTSVRGGTLDQWFAEKMRVGNLVKADLRRYW